MNKERNSRINRDSPAESKREVQEVVYETLTDYLFDKVVFVTLIFSEALNSDGTPVVSTTNLIGTSRITDTSEGKYMSTGKQSRMRCSFYVENADDMVGYLLSPAVFDSFSSLNTIASIDSLRAYVGLKFTSGTVEVCVKEAGQNEVTFPTNLTITGGGASDTYELDIRHNINYTDIYLDGSFLGSYSTNFTRGFNSVKTFLPLLAPIKSDDGSAVGLVIENFQFIQNK